MAQPSPYKGTEYFKELLEQLKSKGPIPRDPLLTKENFIKMLDYIESAHTCPPDAECRKKYDEAMKAYDESKKVKKPIPFDTLEDRAAAIRSWM